MWKQSGHEVPALCFKQVGSFYWKSNVHLRILHIEWLNFSLFATPNRNKGGKCQIMEAYWTEMRLVCVVQYLVAESQSKDQLTLHFYFYPLRQCEANAEFLNYKFSEKLSGAFLNIMLQSIHPWTKPSGHNPPGDRRHLWRRLSECAGQCKNNCKHIIQGVLYRLCTVYWHFLDAVCFANVMSHRIKWRAVPRKPGNLAGSGTELSGNPQEKSQPELGQGISIQVLQAFKSVALVEEHLSKMSITGEKEFVCF